MSTSGSTRPRGPSRCGEPRRIGLLVHPTRNLDEPLRLLGEWTRQHGIEIVQLAAADPKSRVAAEGGEASDSDLIVSIGGDGTTLAALRAGAVADRPGARVDVRQPRSTCQRNVPRDAPRALERFSRGDWLPADGSPRCRSHARWASRCSLSTMWRWYVPAGGQVRLTASGLTGPLFARIAGDGAVVSTPIGTSGYAISAGGPLLLPHVDGYVLTPLPKHGGFAPPLVIASQLRAHA